MPARAARGAQRGDDVEHVHVVARRRAVAVERAGLARPQAVAEDRDHAGLAVRRLARAVDVAEAHDGVRHAVRGRPAAHVGLARELGGAVGRERQRHLRLGRRQRRVVAVQRAAGRRERRAGAEWLRAASTTFSVPPTLTAQSRPGSATEAVTLACAARWKTACGPEAVEGLVERRAIGDVDLRELRARARGGRCHRSRGRRPRAPRSRRARASPRRASR